MLYFEVQSSDGIGTYTVTVEGRPGSIKMFCTCQAGLNGQYCKHRISLLEGVVDSLISDNAHELAPLAKWRIGSRLEAALTERAAAELELAAARAKVKKATIEVAKAMREG